MPSCSINRFTFMNRFNNKRVQLATCFRYHLKDKGQFLASNTTLLPDYPYLTSILILLFAPKVDVVPDEKLERYECLIVRNASGYSRRIDLNFYLTKEDIMSANEIRELLRNSMTKEGLNNPPPNIWKLLKDFVKKKRLEFRT